MGKYRIEVDMNGCIGAGNCVGVDADTYDLQEGKVVLKKTEFDDAELEKQKSAADSCPVKVIKIINAETGEEV